ncbi:hypothetical protein [Streptomyces sp. NPDC048638]|uniref:hypothetical protein n=1 Tax=Streptomyces sp. NPDC048638 TaxID=3365580 RepID=UPI00371FF913
MRPLLLPAVAVAVEVEVEVEVAAAVVVVAFTPPGVHIAGRKSSRRIGMPTDRIRFRPT